MVKDGLLMIIHYLNALGKEKVLTDIVCIQNLDDVKMVALTRTGEELNLKVRGIESVVDDSLLGIEGNSNGRKEGFC